ncbi:menaquinone-specific isochorismate synthase [Haloferula luteola]|uniref:Menaquinone-specific isochorismate synthase n=1 Tax=Haloferula luteola TaxID=595692 RepID=A0A840V0I8_9BACT|nr:chorismate-binding protein [Haloferula luteola]MBB5351877.1 menaquinone-specific isochorismate synthase [Haloferula luteola]
MKDTWAFLGWSGGKVLVGRGPFRASAVAPESGAAFYRNDFGLSSDLPWWIPAEWALMEPAALAREWEGEEPPRVAWEALDASPFAGVFQEITTSIRWGIFEKTVPVVVERGSFVAGAGPSLAVRALAGPPPLVPYGWVDGRGGFAGMSPEHLLMLEGRMLRTMALAGTARAEEREVLAVDEKEIREHEFVAQALVSKLGDLGRLERGAREVLDLGPIVHFHTPIEVALDRDESVESLIRRLHPTPALGPLPRTGETMSRLQTWRERLGAPVEFGAPFGAWVNGVARVLVAIRGVWWRGEDVKLPAGCGVIEASRLVNEWRELRLKREAVKARFGL